MTETPVPTPTQIPWPTPTAYPTVDPANARIDFGNYDFIESYAEMAEQGVGTWQMANQEQTLDDMLTVVLIGVILLGLFSIFRNVRDM